MGNFDNYYIDGNGNAHRDIPLGTSPADAYVRTNMKLKKEVQRIDGAMQEVSEHIETEISRVDEAVVNIADRTARQLESAVNDINESIEEVSDSIDTKIASEVVGINGRVDNIIAHNNNTESNSELIDIRTGTDGTVYSSAGSAVRGQITGLGEGMNALKEDQNKLHPFYEMLCLLTITGYYNRDTKTETTTRLLRVYDVGSVDTIKVSGNFMAYSNVYTLLDAGFNVLSYHLNNTSGTVSYIGAIDVSQARWLLVGSGTSTDSSISVSTNTCQKTINYIQHLNGNPQIGFYHDTTWNSTSSSPSLLFDIAGTDHVIISANADGWFNLYTFTDSQGTILQSDRSFSGNTTIFLPVPSGAAKLYVATSSEKSSTILVKIIKNSAIAESRWMNKKIVWFGTSIPAGGYLGDSSARTYPKMIADMLGADIYNEAVGSSCLHCKKPDRVDAENNPYGFIGNFEAASRCLTNSLTEMQWIIDHYDSDIWTSNTVNIMTDTLKDQILNNSWERKLKKYLTSSTEPALFVFDHGHNDPINSMAVEQSYYEQYGDDSLYTFRGAFNFLMKKILQFDLNAQVVMVGEYSGTDTDQINAMQIQSAQDWNIPLLKTWEKLGWSKTKTIVRNGHWQNSGNQYRWVTDENYSPITVFNAWIADGVHPHSSPTDKPLKRIADVIGNWLIKI